MGCTLADLGYSSDCNELNLHDLKPADFEVRDLPENRRQEQYFIVCVPETTEEDARARSLEPRAYIAPSGPLVPRLLGCPGEMIFNTDTRLCEEEP